MLSGGTRTKRDSRGRGERTRRGELSSPQSQRLEALDSLSLYCDLLHCIEYTLVHRTRQS